MGREAELRAEGRTQASQLLCRNIVKVVEYPGSRVAAMQLASDSFFDELPDHESPEPHAVHERRA
jgi:hypothetical protein